MFEIKFLQCGSFICFLKMCFKDHPVSACRWNFYVNCYRERQQAGAGTVIVFENVNCMIALVPYGAGIYEVF
ncbi:hypothetical protein NAC44_15145 [Allorhizobium sp. BGMRC 0089]|uniref:hypothetical protein n=1 Tax=Allorhizobium sonneratiae TaxID=2934936 RepID=UPI0020342EC2|nr:hypothetical protein [Allorhizobium sonneratiae]MCM2293663.1 hypothetical protein [Allorhizobium sonneratiae]